MQATFQLTSDQLLQRLTPSKFSNQNEIEAQRRRKGSGTPQGRVDRPVYRKIGSNTGGSGSGGGGSYGGWQPTSGGSGGSSGGIPGWMIIAGIVLLLVFGGGGALSSILGGGTQQSAPGGGQSDLTGQYLYGDVATPAAVEAAKPAVGFTPVVTSKEGSWTVMLYQDADDQVLEQDIVLDFNEVELVGSTDQVNIVAQLDRFRGGYTGDGNWTSTRRYYVTKDTDLNVTNSQLIADLGETNMADVRTLVDFVVWTAKNFPADHYVLIMSDHGMGWPGGWTDPSHTSSIAQEAPIAQKLGNAIYLDQLDIALGEIRKQTGIEKFDLIGMDACLMGQLEVLSALEPHARYTVFSEESEPALGWAYTSFIKALTENPGMSAADLSKLIVQSYIVEDQRITNEQARQDYLGQMGRGYYSANQVISMVGKDATLSAVDLSKVPALMDSLDELAYALQNTNQQTVATARNYALSYTSLFGRQVPPSYLDLGSFVQILKQESRDSTVRQLSDKVLTAINQAVIAEVHGGGKQGSTGIAFYFPNSALYSNAYAGPKSYTVIADRFAKNSLWDDFLAFHYNNRTFETDTREGVIPSSGFPSRAPGAGLVNASNIRLSSNTASPGQPVTMRADITGSNIGNIFLFIGYYDQGSNSVFVADTDFLESPETVQVDGVYYPKWGDGSPITLRFDWDPKVFTISDGMNTALALFTPQQYGATAENAIYTVEGIYTFADSGERLNAFINFRDGEMVSVFGITGTDDTGAPREITPKLGDTFTLLDKWLQLDANGNVTDTELLESETVLQFRNQAFTWEEAYAAEGDYIIGFIVTDLDGNSQQVLTQVVVQ